MKKIIFVVAVLGCLVSVFAGPADPDTKLLEGNWQLVKAEIGGKPMADQIVKMISLKLDAGKYDVFVGEEPDRGTYTLDSTTQPKSMSVTGKEGPNAGKTFPAIYELKGDSLRICYELSGTKKPAEFKTAAGTKLYLATYERMN